MNNLIVNKEDQIKKGTERYGSERENAKREVVSWYVQYGHGIGEKYGLYFRFRGKESEPLLVGKFDSEDKAERAVDELTTIWESKNSAPTEINGRVRYDIEFTVDGKTVKWEQYYPSLSEALPTIGRMVRREYPGVKDIYVSTPGNPSRWLA